MLEEFSGRTVPHRDVEDFVWLCTPFVFRKTPLKILEEQQRMTVHIPEGEERRQGAFSDHLTNNMLLTFDQFRCVRFPNSKPKCVCVCVCVSCTSLLHSVFASRLCCCGFTGVFANCEVALFITHLSVNTGLPCILLTSWKCG